jgi:hypothetical protein
MNYQALRHRRGVIALAAGLVALGLGGCSAKGGTAAAPASQPVSAAPTTPAPSSPAAVAGTKQNWRGAVITLPATLRVSSTNDDTLCLKASTSKNPDPCEDHPIEDWVQFYSSERRLGPQQDPSAPLNPSSLDGTDLGANGDWIYTFGNQEDPCDDARDQKLAEKGTKPVGGRDAFYGRFEATCKNNGKHWTSQRWELPKSRIGIVAFTVTPASAQAVRDMVTGIDLSGYRPTSPPK